MRKLKRKVVSGIMLTLLFIYMLTLAFSIQSVIALVHSASSTFIPNKESVANDVIFTPSYENITTHEGDLIINGTQTFLIKNCTFIQTGNVIAKEYSKLMIENAELVMNQTEYHQYEMRIELNARFVCANVTILSDFGFNVNFKDSSLVDLAHVFSAAGACIQVFCYDLSSVNIQNCELLGVTIYCSYFSSVQIADSIIPILTMARSTSSLVTNSTIHALELRFFHTSSGTLKLQSGFHLYWNIHANETVEEVDYNITLMNVVVDEWYLLCADSCSVCIYESESVHVWASEFSTIVINNSSMQSLHAWDNSLVQLDNTVVVSCSFGGRTVPYIVGSKIDGLWIGNFFELISFENTIIHTYLRISNSQFYITGSVKFSEDACIKDWLSSNITRNFNVIVTSEASHPLADAELKLYNRNDAIWTGVTNSLGQANFNVTFSDSNYTNILRLKAIKGTFCIKNVSFLSETSITMVLPTPMGTLEELIETAESWNLDSGIEMSLTSKLQAAYLSLERENQNVAAGQLGAFVNHVEALQGKKLDDEQADYLITEAQRIMELIEG